MIDEEKFIQKMKDSLLDVGDPEPLLVVEGLSGEVLSIPTPFRESAFHRRGQMFGNGLLIGTNAPVKNDKGQQIDSPLTLIGDVARVHIGFMAWMIARRPDEPMPKGSFEHEPDRSEVLVWIKSKHKDDVEGQHFLVERTADGPVFEKLEGEIVKINSFLTDAFWDGLAYGKAAWN